MSSYERYVHHGNEVWVRSDLKGKHRDYCLCYHCKLAMCPVAKELYAFCIANGTVNPVWECSDFVPNPGVRTRAPLERIHLDRPHGENFNEQHPPASKPEYEYQSPNPYRGPVVIPIQDDHGK